MTGGKITIIDLERTERLSCHSKRLAHGLGKLPAIEHVSVVSSGEPGILPSQLVIMCFSSTMPLREAFQALSRFKGEAPVLGLFCSEWATLGDRAKALLDRLDDFLVCPLLDFARARRSSR